MSVQAAGQRPPVESVVAGLSFLGASDGKPCDYAYAPPAGEPWQSYVPQVREVRIADARTPPWCPSIHAEGFELRDAPTAVRDFLDEDAVKGIYYAEAAGLALAATGAKRAYVFDHLVRQRDPARSVLDFGRNTGGGRPSANGRVHNDYTEASGPRKLQQVLGDAAAGVGRYAIVNVWRSIKGPVLDTPLALCDARSVAPADLVAADVRYATRTGEVYLVRHSPRQQWFYYPAMHRGEALVFKQFDSHASGVARYTPHAAFDHPHAPADAPLRESIEARVVVVYE
jgi:hypothetical protein